jgi:hypothetical protein
MGPCWVGEVIFREDQVLAELIGGLLGDSKEFAASSQPKTPATEGFLDLVSVVVIEVCLESS